LSERSVDPASRGLCGVPPKAGCTPEGVKVEILIRQIKIRAVQDQRGFIGKNLSSYWITQENRPRAFG